MYQGRRGVLGFASILVELVVHEAVVQLGHGALRALAVVKDIATLLLVDASGAVEQGALKTQGNWCTGWLFNRATRLLYADFENSFATDARGPRTNGRVASTPEYVLGEWPSVDGLALQIRTKQSTRHISCRRELAGRVSRELDERGSEEITHSLCCRT